VKDALDIMFNTCIRNFLFELSSVTINRRQLPQRLAFEQVEEEEEEKEQLCNVSSPGNGC